MFKLLYFAFVRAKLEYCSVVWSPLYKVHREAIDRVQRKFLKFLYFKTHGVYPQQGYDYALLCSEFDVASLEVRRTLASVVFLVKLANCDIDCDRLLLQINFRSPRETDRVDVPFRLPQVRTNLGLSSPLYVMQQSLNRLARENRCNIFKTNLREFVSYVLNTF